MRGSLAVAIALVAASGCGGSSPGVHVRVSPETADVVPDGTLALDASVAGTLRDDVVWSIVEGPGAISATGTYTAPGFVPFGGANAIRVRATSVVDDSEFADALLRIALPPLSPRFGPSKGGTEVAIDGSSFEEGTRVFFDGVELEPDSVSAFQISVVTSAHAIGAVPIRIETPGEPPIEWPHAFRFAATSRGFAESAAMRPCDLPMLEGAADFAGDGTDDPFFQCGLHHAVVMLDAAGNASEPELLFQDDVSGTLVGADLDGDGAAELVDLRSDAMRIQRWDGETFVQAAPDVAGTTNVAVFGNFTGSAALDLATVVGTDELQLFEGNGDRTFSFVSTKPVSGVQALFAGRVDGDAYDDLLVALNGAFHVHLASGSGTFGNATAYGSTTVRSIVTGDLGSDGDRDVVILDSTSIALYTADIAGSLTFVDGVSVAVPAQAVIADVGGSAASDLLVGVLDSVQIFLDPAGALTSIPIALYTPPGPYLFGIADLDTDDQPDLLLSGATGPTLPQSFMPYVRLLAGRGGAEFGAAPVDALGGIEHDRARPDGADVLVIGASGSGDVVARLGAGSFALDDAASSLETTEIDGDGALDAIVAAGAAALVFPGPVPDVSPVSVAAPGVVREAVPADFDGDGAIDLALAIDGTAGGLAISWGSGFAFDPPENVAPFTPVDLATADMDGDGLVDLVTVASSAGTVVVVPGAPSRTFDLAGSREYFPGAPVSQIATPDLDGDGLPELVLVAQEPLEVLPGIALDHVTVIVLGNLGALQLEERFRYSIPGTLRGEAAVTELDGDGLPDVVLARGIVDSVVVYHGTVEGRLRLGDGVFAGEVLSAFAVADVDSDGLLDLVCGDKEGTVRLLHNRSH